MIEYPFDGAVFPPDMVAPTVLSRDPVGAPLFYRDVPLMPSKTETGVIKPLADNATPLIQWRLRDISQPTSRVVMARMPTCANAPEETQVRYDIYRIPFNGDASAAAGLKARQAGFRQGQPVRGHALDGPAAPGG